MDVVVVVVEDGDSDSVDMALCYIQSVVGTDFVDSQVVVDL